MGKLVAKPVGQSGEYVVPFYMLSLNPAHPAINSVYERSDGWIHFSFLYWSTFPFAAGIARPPADDAGADRGVKRAPAATFAAVVGPACLLIVYMVRAARA